MMFLEGTGAWEHLKMFQRGARFSKVTKSDANRYPKRSQKPPKWTWLDLSKYSVITVQEPHGIIPGEV